MAKILIIDDNAIMRKNIWIMLRHEKHTILEAQDGPEGIGIARAENLDLILLDFMLPYMSGEQVARYMNEHDELRDIPIIVLTAMNQPDLVMNMLKLGSVRDYLLKPIKAETLRGRVRAIVGDIQDEPEPTLETAEGESEEEALAETESISQVDSGAEAQPELQSS